MSSKSNYLKKPPQHTFLVNCSYCADSQSHTDGQD